MEDDKKREELEEQTPGEDTSMEESEEWRLLNLVPGEDDDQVEDTITEGLLQESEEAEEEKEEVKEEVEKMYIEEEQGGRIEEVSFLDVKDPSDPIELNSTKSFSEMAIEYPKVSEILDLATNNLNDNTKPEHETPPSTKSKADAEVLNPTKVNDDSGASHLAVPITIKKKL